LAASRAIVVDYKNTYNIVDYFQPDIISKEKVGNTNLIKIKHIPNQEIFAVERKRAIQFLKDNKQLELVKLDIENINYPFLIVLVFGSYVKKTQTKKSDIDLCILCDNKEKIKELLSKLELLPLKLEIHEFSTNEFEQMLKTKEENVGKEIVKNNIIIYGIENYYNLVSKWMKKE
jgi:predicted nucleotidyltransferase